MIVAPPGRGARRRRRPSPPRVLITGGAGFIGTNLACRLLQEGRRVVLLDSLARPGTEHNLQWLRQQYGDALELVIGDVRNPAVVRRAVAGTGQVFHLAAQVAVTTSLGQPMHDFEVNARGTLTLLEAIREQPDPPSLVFTSTNKVYGSLEDLPLVRRELRYVPKDPAVASFGIDERRPLSFQSPYGCSKGAAEQYVIDYARSFGLQTAVFRMSCIYGPHQHGTEDQGWVAHMLRRARSGAPLTLYGDGRQVRDVLFVGDLVAALMAAQAYMGRLAGQAFNIGGGAAHTLSLLELLVRLEELLGRRVEYELAPWRRADQRYFVADWRRFSALTGWSPRVGVKEGLEQLLAWLETQARTDGRVRCLAVS